MRNGEPNRAGIFAAVIALVFGPLVGCSIPDSVSLRHPSEPVVLRVGTYNIHSGRSGGAVDLQRVAAEIEAAALDIVFLQEVDEGTRRANGTHQARLLAEALGMHWSFAVADRTMDGGRLGNAILSRFPIDHEGGARLPGSLFRVRRAASYAVLEGPHDARILAVSAHFSLNRADRQKSSTWLAQELSSLEGPVIAGVDLNAQPGSAEVQLLPDSFALSAAIATYPSHDPRHAIDRILAAPVGSVGISGTAVARAGVSDHLLLVAEVRLQAPSPEAE